MTGGVRVAVLVMVAAAVMLMGAASRGSAATKPTPVGVGRELRLVEARTPQPIRTVLSTPGRGLVPGTRAVTLRADGSQVVTVSTQLDPLDRTPHRCVNLQVPARPPSLGSVSGTCESGSARAPATELEQVFYYPHVDFQAGSSVYYVWTQVPAATAYVTFDSGSVRA